jgi:hypothetical protein
MRRSIWSRPLVALLGVWFAVYTTDAAALHACSVHDAPGAATDATGATDPHAGHHGSTDGGQDSEQGSCCTCPSDCASAASLLVGSAPILPDAPTVTTAPRVSGADTRVARRVDLALPFANGPPSLT